MSENIKYVHMQHSGPIPDLIGWFNGGQTVTIDMDTMTVVDQAPLAQRAYDASPLVEIPAQEEAPVQPELVPTSEPPIEAQAVDATPAQEVGEV